MKKCRKCKKNIVEATDQNVRKCQECLGNPFERHRRCKKCLKQKPGRMFDGKKERCKECRVSIVAHRESPVKRCPRCGETKDKAEFPPKEKGLPKLHGYCRTCNRLDSKTRRMKPENRSKYSAREKKLYQANRMAVLIHYGGTPPRCACCSEAEIKFLQVDHVHNDGSTHRREMKQQGVSVYIWIKKNGFPPTFQILCANCNLAKGFYGECPHETRRREEAEDRGKK